MMSLAEYYAALGYTSDQWHIGLEHPYLENYALRLIERFPRARVLEIGYQAGGFAVPVILRMKNRPDFVYVGIDNGAYANSVDSSVIADYLRSYQVACQYTFYNGDAGKILPRLVPQGFDLILVDHHEPLYPREFYTIVSRGLIVSGGVVLFHDVFQKAEKAWKECELICRAFGFSSQIVDDIPGGLAVVERSLGGVPAKGLPQLTVRLQVEMLRAVRGLKAGLYHALCWLGQRRQRTREARRAQIV